MNIAPSTTMTSQQESRFAELMEGTYRKVYNMAFRLTGSRADAEDLTQEAFYRAYRSFDDYEGDKPFDNWIFRIVTRLFLDLLRNRRRRVQAMSYDNPISNGYGDEGLHFDVADKSASAEDILVENTLSEDLQSALDTLSAEQRLLVTLADIEQLPYKEIADIMDKPVGTIRSRLHRTHKLLRTRLENLNKPKKAPRPSIATSRLVFG